MLLKVLYDARNIKYFLHRMVIGRWKRLDRTCRPTWKSLKFFPENWYNWPLNDCLISHLTHCLFLHYLGKEKEQNNAFLTTGNIA